MGSGRGIFWNIVLKKEFQLCHSVEDGGKSDGTT